MIHAQFLGTIPFAESEALLAACRILRTEEKISDTLFLYEHPPTFSAGYRGWQNDSGGIRNIKKFTQYVLAHSATLASTKRGGGLMYHGPGQLIMAPVLKLFKGFGCPEYAELLEKTAARFLLRAFSINTIRIRYNHEENLWETSEGEKLPVPPQEHPTRVRGTWVREEGMLKKIAFQGFRFQNPIVYHGTAINIAPDLNAFDCIDPCNLAGVSASSVERILRKNLSVTPELAREAAVIFGGALGSDEILFETK